MATRHYLGAEAESTPIAFATQTGWENTSILARAFGKTTKRGLAMTTVSFADTDYTDKDILFRQYDLGELTPGQRILSELDNEAFVSICIRVAEEAATSNMKLAFGLRIMAANGTTVRATLVPVKRVSAEASATELGSRWKFLAMDYVDYTTVAGDHAVLEIGMGGDPT
jgi:hypothetical protein